DWFQLSLKEGFTVFRDAEFSADMNSRTVKRIEDVAYLRTHQFAEDAGPMAHAVRPDSFIEISNFYTLTVYEKGSEVVRMVRTLLGADGFRKGSDLYFERHDGQAVTCDDFIKAMEDANGVDLTQFKRWYSQAGTPRLEVSESYDSAAQAYSLTFRQSCPPTPDKVEKLPFVIPVELGLLDAQGNDLPLRLAGEAAGGATTRVLSVTEAEQTFTFQGIAAKPLPSLLRGFSAPVKLAFPYDRDQLMFLMQHDSDGFNRWEAGQQLSVQVLQDLINQYQQGAELVLDPRLVQALGSVLGDESLDQAMVAEMLSLPGEAYLTEISQVADVDAIHAAREFARKQIAEQLFDALWARYQANREQSRNTAYVAAAEHFARRSLQNIALSYLMLGGKEQVLAATLEQFEHCDNMTERLTALAVLVNSPFEAERATALESFAEHFKDNPLVMDQWFSVQAASSLPGGLARVKALMQHPAFTLKNPNKVRALIGAFAGQNLVNFHAADGSGYRFLADLVIELNALNPQIASRQLAPLTRWRKYDDARQALMKGELERILASGALSSDVYEVVSKSLA
ncbi:MAG: pepN, partial [Pseudomonas sp.]|nr:pepN [Pseudomonas sp.]